MRRKEEFGAKERMGMLLYWVFILDVGDKINRGEGRGKGVWVRLTLRQRELNTPGSALV